MFLPLTTYDGPNDKELKSSVDLSIIKQLKSKTDQPHTKTLESCCCCLFVLIFRSKAFLLLLNLESIHSSNKNKGKEYGGVALSLHTSHYADSPVLVQRTVQSA